jgi:hypothetical protein
MPVRPHVLPHKGRENDTDATLKGTDATTDEPQISVFD